MHQKLPESHFGFGFAFNINSDFTPILPKISRDDIQAWVFYKFITHIKVTPLPVKSHWVNKTAVSGYIQPLFQKMPFWSLLSINYFCVLLIQRSQGWKANGENIPVLENPAEVVAIISEWSRKGPGKPPPLFTVLVYGHKYHRSLLLTEAKMFMLLIKPTFFFSPLAQSDIIIGKFLRTFYLCLWGYLFLGVGQMKR